MSTTWISTGNYVWNAEYRVTVLAKQQNKRNSILSNYKKPFIAKFQCITICNYCKVGKFGKFGESSMIRQTKIIQISTYNK